MTNKCLRATLLLGGLFLAGELLVGHNALPQSVEPAASRDSTSLDQQIAMLRSDLRSNRKQIIAANMKLTDVEAEKFWPTYDKYVAELVQINNTKYAIIKEYLQNTNMTEEQADGLSRRWLEVDESVVQLRLNTSPSSARRFPPKGQHCSFSLIAACR